MSCLGLPLAVTFQVKVSSSPMRRSIVVSGRVSGPVPGQFAWLHGPAASAGAAAGAAGAGCVSAVAAAGENCLTSWAESVSWGARATTCLS